jgi:hypothetical protein
VASRSFERPREPQRPPRALPSWTVDQRQIAGSGCVPGLVAAHSVCRRTTILCADQRGFVVRYARRFIERFG